MKARVTWVEGMTFLGESGSNNAVVMDASPANGGKGIGASPMELLLLGTGGCTGIDVVSILKKMRQKVTGCSVELEGERPDEHPKVFTGITMRFIVEGHGLDRAKVERAVQLSAEQYCSASIMMGKTAEIRREVVIREADGGTAG
ncbi:OsmC family protein [Geminicoccaceae bacterium 1502E]|nr:OsmC family protein [Geminicoccaceae bacterium 1502E]